MQIFIGQSVDTTIFDGSVHVSSSFNDSALDPATTPSVGSTEGKHLLFYKLKVNLFKLNNQYKYL